MRKNNSPWVSQLKSDRLQKELTKDTTTDVAIVGAGIAGVSTAFYILKNTNKNVVMVDRFKLAHGATGHNAGQVVSYFERGFANLAQEFGLELAAKGQQAVEDSWNLIEEMYTTAGLNIPFSRFQGHAGLSSKELVLHHLENNLQRKTAKLRTEDIHVASDAPFLNEIPKQYASLYSLAPRATILRMLETTNNSYVAVVSYQKGCVNSALFCEEVVLYLLKKYTRRFALYEHTRIEKIVLKRGFALLDGLKAVIRATKVVLCTNGFDDIHILNETGLDIDAKFHHMLHGTVGYMSGYLEKQNKPPTAISYLSNPNSTTSDPYYYLTRRYYEWEGEKEMNLISIGGPEASLDHRGKYSHESEYPDEVAEQIDQFVRSTYNINPNRKIEYAFTWHGLMGYTKNGVRLIGVEPKNHALLYNLGCNGVGILPSIYGGFRISQIVGGKRMEKSMFDIPERVQTDEEKAEIKKTGH